MSVEMIARTGHFIKHGIGVLLLCWRRVLRATLFGGVLGVLVAELVAALMEQRFPPGMPAHIAAIAFGLACGYGAGLTLLLDELLIGTLDTVKWLGGEAEAGLRAAAAAAGREARQVRPTVARVAVARRADASNGRGAQSARTPVAAPGVDDETVNDFAATEDFQNTAPRPRVNARPVPAGDLPRITWAFEQLQRDNEPPGEHDGLLAAAEAEQPQPAVEMPPLPRNRALAPTVPAPSTAPTASAVSSASTASSSFDLPASPSPEVPTSLASPEPPEPPTMLSPAPEERGVWSRISRKLVGEQALARPDDAGSAPEKPQQADVSGPPA